MMMMFAFDHAPSKYVQIEQSTDTFTAFSRVQYPGSHVTLYTVFLRRYDTLVIVDSVTKFNHFRSIFANVNSSYCRTGKFGNCFNLAVYSTTAKIKILVHHWYK